jgi:uncharacterized protein (DUF4415 family)
MTDRKRSKSEERSYAALMGEICDLEHLHRTMQLKKRVLPPAWDQVEKGCPVRPRKTRMTIGLDAETARWFRAMGTGYQARINAVLRIYMLARKSKEIEGQGDRSWNYDPI